MALPLIPLIGGIAGALRLPALVAFLTQIFASVFGYLAARVGPAMARNSTVLTAIVGIAGIAYIAMQALYSGLNIIIPDYLGLFNLIKPPSLDLCISTIVSARFTHWLFMWKWFAIERMSRI